MSKKITYKNDIYKIYINQKMINASVKKISNKIEEYYFDKNPIIIGVLKGSVYFMMDILKNINFKYEIDFVDIKSYLETINHKPVLNDFSTVNPSNRYILIIEDIIDTGKTINKLIELFSSINVNEIKVATLLKKNKNEILS